MLDHRLANLIVRMGAIACVLAAFTAAAQTTAPEYSLRREGRAVVGGGILPINKKYAELTEEQKDLIRLAYENMGRDDEPPFPAEGLGAIYEAVADAQGRLLVSGELSLVATVASDGRVLEVKAYRSPHPEMTRVVSHILFLTPFKPALCKGRPCRMDYPFDFIFKFQ